MRRRAAVSIACLSILAAPRLLAAGGTIQHKNVALTYSSAHWGSSPNASLVGTETGINPLYRTGWWYRVVGVDTREYPFPPPDSETYGADGKLIAIWNNVAGKGFSARETTWVFDDERPSGGFVSEIYVSWGTNPVVPIALFHFLDVDVAGSFTNDSAILRGNGFIKITDGSSTLQYRTYAPQHFMVAPYDNTFGGEIKRRLNDTLANDLDDTGLPFGPGDITAGYQFRMQGAYGVYNVAVAANMASDYFRGQGPRFGSQPNVHFRTAQGLEYSSFWNLRQTALQQSYSAYTVGQELLGSNDFDGDASGDNLFRGLASNVLTMYASAGGSGNVANVPPLPADLRLAATFDFDGDGRADLLWRNTTTQKLSIWLMNGAQKVGDRTPNPDQPVDANWSPVGVGDFDNDGDGDLLWYNQTSGRLVVWHLDANQVRVTGGFTDPASVGSNIWRAVAVGDFGRGDPSAPHGTPDILWQNDVSKKLVVWHLDFAAHRVVGGFTTPDTAPGEVFMPR